MDTADGTHHGEHEVERLWSTLLPGWSGVVGAVHRRPADIREIPSVPEPWVELLARDSAIEDLVAAWSPLPRFSAWLASSLLDVAVGTGMGGPVMVYLLRDWSRPHGEAAPGLMLGGAPTGALALEGFQDEVGPLPTSLITAWRLHSYLLLWDGQWLGSLAPAGEAIAPRPRMAPRTSKGQLGGRPGRYECLSFAKGPAT